MGEASRRKKAKQRGQGVVPASATSLPAFIREMREALVAEARAFFEGEPMAAAAVRVETAASEIRALLELDNDASSDVDIVGPDPNRLTSAFMRDVAGLSAMQLQEWDPPSDAGTGTDADLDDDIREIGLYTAERLVGFEGLALGTRVRTILDGGDALTFATAAICVLGPSWDPLATEPLDGDDLGRLVAALAATRATLLMIAVAESDDAPAIGDAIAAAATALRALPAEQRAALADGNSSVSWQVARALAAGFGPDNLATIRTIGGQVPLVFAAGAFGEGWLGGSDAAEPFDQSVAALDGSFSAIDADEIRHAVAVDPLLAAYVAGRTARETDGSRRGVSEAEGIREAILAALGDASVP